MVTTDPAPQASAKPRRGPLLAGLAALALVGASGAFYALDPLALFSAEADSTTTTASAAPPASTDAPKESPKAAGDPGAKADGREVLILEDMIVNLRVPEGAAPRYARVRIALSYDRTALGIGVLQSKKPYLRDAFLDFMNQLAERDLHGTYGLSVIKEELLRRARTIAASNAVADVLITDLVIQ